MKILLDMNIPHIWKEFLTEQRHEAIHWSDVGNIRAENSEIMEWARVNHYIVFTHDLDFGALLYATNAKKPSVIQLRIENILPSAVGNIVLDTLLTVAEELKKRRTHNDRSEATSDSSITIKKIDGSAS